jgi:hypothetical protein
MYLNYHVFQRNPLSLLYQNYHFAPMNQNYPTYLVVP